MTMGVMLRSEATSQRSFASLYTARKPHMTFTRRVLLTLTGLAVLGSRIPAYRKMLGQILFSPKAPRVPTPQSAANPFKNGSKSLVAMVHGTDVPAMVERAIELIGGLGKLQLAGTRTLLKPNVVGSGAPPIITDLRVMQGLGALVQAEKPASLVVGEMSAVMALPTRPNLERSGMVQLADGLGADIIAFDEEDWVEVRPPKVEYATTVYVAKAAYEAQRLISVPVIKTHRHASFSCALKNTVGCVHGKNKPWMYGSGWEAAVAELNAAIRPHLYVVDGLQSLVRGGPWAGDAVPTQVILASGDPIATDVVALGLIKTFGRWDLVTTKGVWEQVQIRRAIALGLGA
ncbi:MAG: DUF362 domain-containing protein, partial [Planctomycetaceae bacterium]